MAAIFWTARIAEQQLDAATAETLVQVVAPTNQRVNIHNVSITFNGTSATAEPVNVDFIIQDDAGTSTNATPNTMDADISESVQSRFNHTFTAEPTTDTTTLFSYLVHPQGGFVWVPPMPFPLVVNGGARLGIKATAPAQVNAVVTVLGEE